jgi:MFS family permease
MTIVFVSNGFLVGTWQASIPAAKGALGLPDFRLGLVLALATVGTIVVSPLVGFASARFGSRRLLRVFAPLTAGTYILIGLASSEVLLGLALFLMGVVSGFINVSMNTQAIALEGRHRRTILSTMHGSFSIGMVGGALIAALVTWLGVSYRLILVTVGGIALMAGLAIGSYLIDTDIGARAGRRRIRVSLPLAVIIVAVFLDLFCEGAAANWSGVYTHDMLHTSEAVAALTFGIYTLTLTAGRFAGDNLVMRMGVGSLIRSGGAITACGMGLALLFPSELMILIGFGLVGLGLSWQAPTLFRAAGQLPLPEGQAITVVVMAAWPAFLVVGPLIGGLASVTSLRVALLAGVGAAVATIALSGLLGRLSPAPVEEVEAETAT